VAVPRGSCPRARLRLGAWLGLALAAVPALAGCFPPQASYNLGLTTTRVEGTLEVEDPQSAGEPLILVYQYHYSFIEMNEERGPGMGGAPLMPGEPMLQLDGSRGLAYPTASLAAVRPDGSFTISVPADVVRLEIFFVSPDRLTDVFQFSKQLGVGRIVYDAKLPRMRGWRSHFYTYLMPELQHVIVDPRYKLPLQDQGRIGAWLDAQRTRLEAMRKPAPAKP